MYPSYFLKDFPGNTKPKAAWLDNNLFDQLIFKVPLIQSKAFDGYIGNS